MRIASIDIGTNTVLLLVADVDAEGVLHAVGHEQRFPRLGKNVDARKMIQPEGFSRLEAILKEYSAISKQLGAERIVACATSAVRDAANREEFLRILKEKTGIQIEVLSGEDEALWSYRGAIGGLNIDPHKAAVLDIGGGSTEITYYSQKPGSEEKELRKYSFQLGSVRITEKFLKHDPPLPIELMWAKDFIFKEYQKFPAWDTSNYILIGVAGTVTTLACLEQSLKQFDVEKVSGYVLDKRAVNMWLKRLSGLTNDRILTLSETTEGRADILTAGTLILSCFMEHFGFSRVLTSERGLRYGLVMREWERR